MKKIISVIVVFLIMILGTALDAGFGAIIAFWNAPSLLLVVLISVPMLIIADGMGDYIRGFKILVGNNQFTTKEMESSLVAVGLMIKLIFISAAIGFFIGGINMLGALGDPYRIGPAVAVAVLTIFYSIIINMFHYAMIGKIKKEIIYRG